MIFPASGNLLKAPVQALVNTVNTEGVMGKGIALQFRHAFPVMFKEYELACAAGDVQLGHMHVHDRGGLIEDGPRWIINFPTKGHWRAKSKLQDVAAGLADLVRTVQDLGIESIAVPPLGCGNGGLDWAKVRPLIEQAFAQVPNVQVHLYAPTGTPAAADMPVRTAKPKMTPGQATLLALMRRYQQGLIDPLVSLLEVHKLMYFMQEAGERLSLRYQAAKFGPFALNLSQLLNRMEGHYISGFGDGTSDPQKELDVLPEGVEQAFALLASKDATMKRLDRVTRTIAGYEDPYGMELLSTVLWVITHHEDARNDPDVAVERVHAWNTRKMQLLKAAHVHKAWHRLREQDWHLDAASLTNA